MGYQVKPMLNRALVASMPKPSIVTSSILTWLNSPPVHLNAPPNAHLRDRKYSSPPPNDTPLPSTARSPVYVVPFSSAMRTSFCVSARPAYPTSMNGTKPWDLLTKCHRPATSRCARLRFPPMLSMRAALPSTTNAKFFVSPQPSCAARPAPDSVSALSSSDRSAEPLSESPRMRPEVFVRDIAASWRLVGGGSIGFIDAARAFFFMESAGIGAGRDSTGAL